MLAREGTRQLPTVSQNNQEYVALEDLAAAFGLTFKEDPQAGGLTITARGRTIILTADQSVVSVAGRLVSLTTAPVRQGTRWLIPLDFLPRALGGALDTRIELRRNARLLIVGDLRVPRVVARVESGSGSATVTFDMTPPGVARVTTEPGRMTVSFDADIIDLVLPSLPASDYITALQPGDTPTTVRIATGPRFGMHRATTTQPDASSSRTVIEFLPSGTETALPVTPPAAPRPLELPNPIPATGVRTDRDRSGPWRRRARRARRAWVSREADHAVGGAALARTDREPSRAARLSHARRRPHDVARRSIGLCQQSKGRRLRQHSCQRRRRARR